MINQGTCKWAATLAGLLLLGGASRSLAQMELQRCTIDGGGAMGLTGGDFELSGTIGQPDAGEPLTGGDFELTGGFWCATDAVDGPEPPGVAPPPHDRRKNRFLSFLPNNADRPVAFQVELTAVGPPECYDSDPGGDVGMTWWVTGPVCTDTNGNDTGAVPGVDPCPEPNVWRAGLDSAPQGICVWPEDVIHIAGCPIIPVATYELVAYDGLNFSTPLELATIRQPDTKCWADCVGAWNGSQWTPPNEVVNMDDVTAAVFYFTHADNKPHRTWVEVDDAGVNMVLNFADIMRIVQGFQGLPYPFSNPGACPPSPPAAPMNASSSAGGDEMGTAGHDLAQVLPDGRSSDGGRGTQPLPHGRGSEGTGGLALRRFGDGYPALAQAAITLVPDRAMVRPGEAVAVDVYAAGALNLAVYEVALEVSGPGRPPDDSPVPDDPVFQTASAGRLILEDLFVDHARQDFVFGGIEFLDAADEIGGRLGALALDQAIDVVEAAYLGTFVFRASPDAEGTFYLNLRGGPGTFLRTPPAALIPFLPVSPVAIIVDAGGLTDLPEPGNE